MIRGGFLQSFSECFFHLSFSSLTHYRLVGEWFCGDMVFFREGTLHKCSGDEGSSAGFECLLAQDHGRDLSSDEQQCHSGDVSKEAKGYGISGHVQTAPGDHYLVGAAHGQYHGQVHYEEEENFSEPVNPLDLIERCYFQK